jgi:RNA 2',3'-cyclic 3'-phosphodiesterase
MERLFIAVWPPGHVVEQLSALPRPDQRGVRWIPHANWHVTLRFLGAAEPTDAISGLAGATLPAATAAFGPAVRRLGQSALVVPVSGLEGLAAAVTAVTADIGDPPGPRPFNGHLTLARLRAGSRCDLTGMAFAAEAAVGEVVLVRSDLSRDGATYHVVGRWPTG